MELKYRSTEVSPKRLLGRPVTCFSVVWTLRVVDTARLMIYHRVRAAADRIVMRCHENIIDQRSRLSYFRMDQVWLDNDLSADRACVQMLQVIRLTAFEAETCHRAKAQPKQDRSAPEIEQRPQTRLRHIAHAVSRSNTTTSSTSMASSSRRGLSQSSHLDSWSRIRSIPLSICMSSVLAGALGRLQKACSVLFCGLSCAGAGTILWLDGTGSASGCFRWASYSRLIVDAAARHASASMLICMTAPSQQDTPWTICSSGRSSRCLLRVRLLRCCAEGSSSYVGKAHVCFS